MFTKCVANVTKIQSFQAAAAAAAAAAVAIIRANAGTRDIGTINSNNRIGATMYSLGTLFVSGIYVKIPCIKEIMIIIIIIKIIIIIIIG
jgi:hypothetical protein